MATKNVHVGDLIELVQRSCGETYRYQVRVTVEPWEDCGDWVMWVRKDAANGCEFAPAPAKWTGDFWLQLDN